MSESLTPPERETVVLMDDSTDIATVSTYQRRTVTRLQKNPAATKIEDLTHGTTAGAKFEIPAALVSFRSKRRAGGPGNPQALEAARVARQQPV